jgi:hypothetical protein
LKLTGSIGAIDRVRRSQAWKTSGDDSRRRCPQCRPNDCSKRQWSGAGRLGVHTAALATACPSLAERRGDRLLLRG